MSSGISLDEFQALEQKVLRAVEIVKREREARTAAEADAAALREQLTAQDRQLKQDLESAERRAKTAEAQVATLTQDRDAIRQRVEKMLHQMDELL